MIKDLNTYPSEISSTPAYNGNKFKTEGVFYYSLLISKSKGTYIRFLCFEVFVLFEIFKSLNFKNLLINHYFIIIIIIYFIKFNNLHYID